MLQRMNLDSDLVPHTELTVIQFWFWTPFMHYVIAFVNNWGDVRTNFKKEKRTKQNLRNRKYIYEKS